jgi:hypothetical protein
MRETALDLFTATTDPRAALSPEQPITVGVPFPRGLVANDSTVVLRDATGNGVPVQRRVLDRWTDGSVRWLLLDFSAPRRANRYHLAVGAPDVTHPEPASALVVNEREGTIVVDTGAARFTLERGGPFPFADVTVRDRSVYHSVRSGLWVTDAQGGSMEGMCDRIEVEEHGPLRTVVKIGGALGQAGFRSLLDFEARLTFYAGSAAVRFAVSVCNWRPARHRRGYWDLGDAGSVQIRDVSVLLACRGDGEGTIGASLERGQPFAMARESVHVYQESSGGPNWRSVNHVNRDGVVPLRFNGYQSQVDQVSASGMRATPIVAVRSAVAAVACAVPHFWENFPKGLTASPSHVALRLFPAEFPDLHEIQGGERKTHVFVAAFGDETMSEAAVAWALAPRMARACPAWYAEAEVVPYLTPAAEDPHPEYVALADAAIEARDGFVARRDIIDEYGWRHFGDLYADHEAVELNGPSRVSHYNNQYDAIAGLATQFMRSADPRWWSLMADLATHVVDIDMYHTTRDRAAYNHGLFWHTSHSTDAATSTHRSYTRSSPADSGGPSAQHNYTTGLMLHHFLTGDPLSREAVVDLSRFVMDLDDASKTPYRWVAPGETGLASHSPWVPPIPGRAAANSVSALLDGHRITGDAALLKKAERIIRRTIHPSDDIDRMDLLEAETTWSYTMFLEALGRYLDYKIEIGELDEPYAYGRAALLHYARWMATNEFPYLDRPEKLVRPTETWAAQDLRKHEAFVFAARHASGDERARFLARADDFFRDAVARLHRMPTRSLTRPVVIVLTHGCRTTFQRLEERTAPAPRSAVADFGNPETVICQKDRVKRRLALIGTTAAAILIAIVLVALA